MKTFVSLSALVIALTLAGSVPATPNPDAQAMPPPKGGVISNDPWSANDGSENPRVVTGRVLRVDAQEGTLVIQTPIGLIALRGPSADLRDVSVGDIVQVEMVAGDDHPGASPPMDEDDDN